MAGGITLLLVKVFSPSHKRDWRAISPLTPQSQWLALNEHLYLAQSREPYLVLNPLSSTLELHLQGTSLWGAQYQLVGKDSEDLPRFLIRMTEEGKRWMRRATGVHLFSFSGKIPDSVLTIVSRALNVSPITIQRDIPHKFRVWWEGGCITDFLTEGKGKKNQFWRNLWVNVHTFFQRLRGAPHIVLKMDSDDAITLYRIFRPGMPLLIYSPPP